MKYSLLFLFAVLAMPAFAQSGPLGVKNSKAPIAIDADTLEVLQNENKAIFSGNVIATQDQMTLKSDQMIVYYRQKDKNKEAAKAAPGLAEQNGISKIDVNGNVFITSPEETARGDKGTYDVDHKVIHLTSNVVLTKGKNVLKGNSAEYDVSSGRSLMNGGGQGGANGRVRGLFIPGQ